jgi:hypothetical protein
LRTRKHRVIPREVDALVKLALDLARGNAAKAKALMETKLFRVALEGGKGLA